MQIKTSVTVPLAFLPVHVLIIEFIKNKLDIYKYLESIRNMDDIIYSAWFASTISNIHFIRTRYTSLIHNVVRLFVKLCNAVCEVDIFRTFINQKTKQNEDDVFWLILQSDILQSSKFDLNPSPNNLIGARVSGRQVSSTTKKEGSRRTRV